MRLGVPKEKNDNETRVSVVPMSIPKLAKLGFDIVVEKGAGKNQVILIPNTKKREERYQI